MRPVKWHRDAVAVALASAREFWGVLVIPKHCFCGGRCGPQRIFDFEFITNNPTFRQTNPVS